ncbi:MAG TPA: hypothetical protein VHS03_06870 [Gaiellaceae bacterium]|nr:hypothetical protein [Gaiellaceae bacterium]
MAVLTLAGVVAAGQVAAASVKPTARHGRHPSDATHVIVPRGQPLQIALTADTTDAPDFTRSFENAVGMAIDQHPSVKGFPIKLNVVETRCGQDASVEADDWAAAQTIVANRQNTAVLGNLCSFGFSAALAVYQSAGLVTITGSATADWLPSPIFSVLDRTVVSDGEGFSGWYARVQTLGRDLAWRSDYTVAFGSPPTPFADLYFDAANLLVDRLQQVSRLDAVGDLIISRVALAAAVRNTTNFPGVSCTITLDPTTGNRVNDPTALDRCGTSH